MNTVDFLRQFRFSGYAVFDFVAALLGMYLFSPLLSKFFLRFKIYVPKRNWLFLTLPIGIIVHVFIGEITPLTKNFIDIHSNYLLKILILGLLVLGLRGIKTVKK